VLDDWMQAAASWGLPKVTDFNTGNNEGVGYFRVNQRGGWRMNTAKAFLRTVTGSTLKVETKAHTRRILIEDGRAVGVEYDKGGSTHQVRARGEVVLSAGAVNSPQILQLSGLGPGELLQRHGIAVLQDMPAVGANLQDHLQLAAGQGQDWVGICAETLGADVDGTQSAGRLFALASRSGDAGSGISRAAPDAGGLWPAAA
jgi:choline dehydrogenase